MSLNWKGFRNKKRVEKDRRDKAIDRVAREIVLEHERKKSSAETREK